MDAEKLAEIVVDTAIRIHRGIGPGLSEKEGMKRVVNHHTQLEASPLRINQQPPDSRP